MDSRLYQASVNGDVHTLQCLIHENPLILENATVGRLNQNPLHIAALVGHLEFTRALLSLNTNLATKPNSRGRCPLHLASEKGHVEIVRELLLHANDAVCLQVDEEGRIPLHLAAMRGHVNVIMELIGARPESFDTVTNEKNNETVLHLCVRYNRLEALKWLLDLAPSDSLVYAQDNDGNTILHLAKALQNTEIIEYLHSLPVEKEKWEKMKNKKKFSKIIAGFPRKYLTIDESWLNSRGHLMTTSTVIATVAFQAGVTPPGGVWQDGIKGSTLHTEFVFFNTVSFATSIIVILLLISGIASKNKVLMGILNIAIFYSIISMAFTYSISVQIMNPVTIIRRTLVITCKSAAYICYAVLPFVSLPYGFYISNWVQKNIFNWVKNKLIVRDRFEWVMSNLRPDGSSATRDCSAA